MSNKKKIAIPKAYHLYKAVATVDDSSKFSSFVQNISSMTELLSLRRALLNVNKPLICGWCPVHAVFHSDDDACENKHCQKRFGASYKLNSHRKSHTHGKPFTCEICLKQFREEVWFSRHKMSHNKRMLNGKPLIHQCSECPEAFAFKKELRQHRLDMHLVKKKHNCCGECGIEISNVVSVDENEFVEEACSCDCCSENPDDSSSNQEMMQLDLQFTAEDCSDDPCDCDFCVQRNGHSS